MTATTETRPFAPFRGSFEKRLEPERFIERTTAFDKIVSATHNHFWDPNDPDYIDFSTPFDMAHEPIMPFESVPELMSDIADRLTEAEKIAFANDSAHWWLSGFLHGEQGALSLSLSLAELLGNPGAVEYATNQAREEGRHVTAFTRYIEARWGAPLPVNPVFGKLLADIVEAPDIYKKIIGMQILVEGLAMGFMANLYTKANDPLLKRLAQLVMTDETFHHKAGKLWAEIDLPHLSQGEREAAEDWALACFQALMFNVFNPSQKEHIYAKYGLDTEEVRAAVRRSYTEETRRAELARDESVFGILVRTLRQSGLITERTGAAYAKWVDLEGLDAGNFDPVESAITAEGIAFLEAVNSGKRHRHRPISTI